jgi:hypothetical protein
VRDAFDDIESAALRLLRALHIEKNSDPDEMPQPIKSGLRGQAEWHGEQIGGYDDMPPTPWQIEGAQYVDFHGHAKVKQVVQGIVLLRLWALRAKARAAAHVKDGQRRRRKLHTGDRALNDWFGNLAGIWLDVYERVPATSVGAVGTAEEGIGGGPFVRFIQAALRPVLGDTTPDTEAIRSRARRLFPPVKLGPKKS